MMIRWTRPGLDVGIMIVTHGKQSMNRGDGSVMCLVFSGRLTGLLPPFINHAKRR